MMENRPYLLDERFKQLRCCVLIPSYNNANTLPQLLKGVLAYTSHVIVVNDGATDNTPEILKSLPVDVVTHPVNQGKGKALRNGFAHAVEKGYEYAITLDSDGQHLPEDLPAFLDMIEKHPGSLVIGARNMEQASVPGKSSFGNKFSNFWYFVETGITMPDTQSGYRLYPLKALQHIKFYTNKFEFEIEVIVRAAWRGIPVLAMPVQVFYAPAEERVTHFRPFQDFSRISVLNTVLVPIALLWYHPYRFIKEFSWMSAKKKLYEITIGSPEPARVKAMSMGFGAFMGLIPVWGYQMLLAVSLAHVLKLNKALVLLASNISIPPLVPFIIYICTVFGAYILGKPTDIHFPDNLSFETIGAFLVQYLIGSVLLAILAGLVFFAVSFPIFKSFGPRVSEQE